MPTHTRTCIPTRVHTHVQVCMCSYVLAPMHLYSCTPIHMCSLCTPAHVCKYSHSHTPAPACTHTHTALSLGKLCCGSQGGHLTGRQGKGGHKELKVLPCGPPQLRALHLGMSPLRLSFPCVSYGKRRCRPHSRPCWSSCWPALPPPPSVLIVAVGDRSRPPTSSPWLLCRGQPEGKARDCMPRVGGEWWRVPRPPCPSRGQI